MSGRVRRLNHSKDPRMLAKAASSIDSFSFIVGFGVGVNPSGSPGVVLVRRMRLGQNLLRVSIT
eukprot:1526376-Amphidinium_carterae.1